MKLVSKLVAGLALTSSVAAYGAADNQTIIDMVKAGVPVDAIISSVRSEPTKYDHSPAALIELAKAGVPQPVISALASADVPMNFPRNSSAAAMPPAMAAYSETVGVTMIDGASETPLTVAPIGLKLGMLKMMTSGFLGKTGGVIRSGPAINRAKSRHPVFRVSTPINIDPKSTWGIVRLEPSGKNLKFDLVNIMNQSPKHVVPVTFQRVANTPATATWTMTPTADFQPGEYIVIAGSNGEDSVQPYQFGID